MDWKPGDALTSGRLNEPLAELRGNRLGRSGHDLARSPIGTRARRVDRSPIWARVSGSTSPYSFTSQVETDAAGTWDNLPLTGSGNAYEVNSVAGLNATVQRLYPSPFGEWRFQASRFGETGYPATGCPCAEDYTTPIPDSLTVSFHLGSVVVDSLTDHSLWADSPEGTTCAWFGSSSFLVPGVKCSGADITLEIGFYIYYVPSDAFVWKIIPVAKFNPGACFDGCSTVTVGTLFRWIPVDWLPLQIAATCSPVYGEWEYPDGTVDGVPDPDTICEVWARAVFPLTSTIILTP